MGYNFPMSRISRILMNFFLIATCFLAIPLPARAQIATQDWSGVCTNTGDATGVATIQGFQCLIGNILSVAITLLGLIGFAMLIIGSFRYLLSGGNSKGTEEGKNTMTFAIVGLVVALSAYFILNLIADFTGVKSILQFRLQIPG